VTIPTGEKNAAAAATALFVETLVAPATARIPVAGMSMAPLLLPGDEIEIEARRDRAWRRGEILLLAPRDPSGAVAGLVVHRLIRMASQGLLVRGDAARSADPSWPVECAIAVVRARWRGGERTELGPRSGRAPWRSILSGRLPAILRRLAAPRARARRPR